MSTGMIIVLTGVFFYLLTCIAILDIARKDFGGIHYQALWAFICMIPFIGVVIYLIFGFKKGQKRRPDAPSNGVEH